MTEPARPIAGLPPDEWKAPFGFSNYLASKGGHIWSARSGILMKTKISGTTPYPELKVTDDSGTPRTMGVHVLVLLAHRGQPKPGQMASHINDVPTDNRLENLVWEDQPANERRKFDNGRPRPVPPPRKPAEPRACVRCGDPVRTNGRRCSPCVQWIGEEAALLLESGVDLDKVGEMLDYPHLSGLHKLARVHGGYGVRRSRLRDLAEALLTLRDRFLERVCSRDPRGGDRA